jgi:YggT family protein
VQRALAAVTEPVLRPIRRILPPVRAGGMAIDLSILVVILVAEIVVIPLLRS